MLRPFRAALAIALVAATPALAVAQAQAAPMDPAWVAKWRADLAFMADSVPPRHPSFYHAVSRERYRAALDSLSSRLPTLGPYEAVVELARIVALVGDGHTRLTLPWDEGAGFFTGHAPTAQSKIDGLAFRHYPIRLGLFGDSLCVTRADSIHRDLLGGRLVRIGNRSATEAMALIEPTVSRDNGSQVRGLLPISMVCPEILKARGVASDMEHLPIVVEREGRRIETVLEPAPKGASVSWVEARSGEPPLRDRFPERSHWFRVLPGTKTVYARYRAVMDDKDESVATFADSLFAAVERTHADRLILDLRGNVGGNGFLNKPLLQHLIRAERLYRPGALWAIVDRGTFSAAVMLAADLEMRTPTILVGEPTGGHPNSWGDAKRIVLPNTGLTVRVSSLYWQLTSPQDSRDAIVPHVPVEETFADWRANRDPALDAAAAGAGRGDPSGRWKGAMAIQFQRSEMSLDLTRRGSTYGGQVTLADADVHDAPLGATQVSAGHLTTHWGDKDSETTFRARLAGDRLVGLIRFKGIDFPVVLERAPANSAVAEPTAR
jgi:hypothetical protein